ncbi:MAG: (2Fe-2S)-binding protein [Candidatus Latescibacterota bacterium]|nr:MAG: (2Fe-2S)-binding protein [Candidatus Latescibacterota bacterium]
MSERDVTFYFEGRRLAGRRGEPIAKALFRAGVRTLSYSVKYKRPRGIHCARGRCVMCHMSVDGVPGVPTCITPLEDGLRVERENYQPFFAPILTAAVRLFPFKAGFYYRMFNRPRWLRRFFLHNIRKMAGVGRIRTDPGAHGIRPAGGSGREINPETERASFADAYDIVVVGAGLSGLNAAHEASRHGTQSPSASGLRILVIDEYGKPGGHWRGFLIDSEMAASRDRIIEETLSRNDICYRPGTTALGFYPPDTLLIGSGGSTGFEPYTGLGTGSGGTAVANAVTHGVKRIRARAFVFATGAYDVTPLFENNDTPGIFGPRAIRLLLERDRLRPGTRAVVYGTGGLLEETTALLKHHGIRVASTVKPGGETKRIGDYQIQGRIVSARGKEWITGITVAVEADGKGGNVARRSIDCDMLCIAFPGQPAYELPYQAGFDYTLTDDPLDENRTLLPRGTAIASNESGVCVVVAGEAAGVTDAEAKVASGKEAGRMAAEAISS